MFRRPKAMDEQACREALYGGPREVRAEPLTRQAETTRAAERIRVGFKRRLRLRTEEEAA